MKLKSIFSLSAIALVFLPCLLLAETTFSMVKPTAVKEQKAGEIIAHFQANGLKVVALKMAKMTPEMAGLFYQEHQGKPFFDGLVSYMTSGPVVALVLEGDNAVQKARELIGSTDPKQADPKSIRALFGKSKSDNAVHGSDSVQSAQREIPIFFTKDEIFSNQ